MITIRGTKLFFVEFYNRLQVYNVPIAIILCFAALALALNAFFYQFPGNDYIHQNAMSSWFYLIFSLILFCRIYGVKIVSNKTIQGYLLFFVIVGLSTLAVNAMQYTPFNPIDVQILELEKILHISSLSLVIWAKQHHTLSHGLYYAYNFLTFEMIIIPIYVLAIKKYDYFYEYLHLILIAMCFGFIFYYLFPTTGPASNLPDYYFRTEQLETGLKFWQIHHYQQPTTTKGGMVAMPSFHVIWAWLVVHLIRFQPICCLSLAIINIILTVACVLLGWHYCLDLVGSFFVLTITLYIYKKIIGSRKMVNIPFIDDPKINLWKVY